MSEWISVDDLLPRSWEQILVSVALSRRVSLLAFYRAEEGVFIGTDSNEIVGVTHWLPIPSTGELD